MLRAAVFTLVLTAGVLPIATVAADGEAGLVIHWGDGRVSTHCIAFEGDNIGGDELLESAGYDINQFSGLVCAIKDVGCQHSGSFDSCTCECQSGGDDCTYWGLFQQPYGATWRYSALGVFVARAEDGDLQGWKWGEGGPANAPVPPATTFEAVCGHSPGAVSTAPPAATTRPPSDTPTATTAPGASPQDTATASTAVSATLPATAATSTAPPEAETATAVPTVDAASATIPLSTPGAPASGNGDSGSNAGLIAFGVIAGGLLLATAAAVTWRLRRGA